MDMSSKIIQSWGKKISELVILIRTDQGESKRCLAKMMKENDWRMTSRVKRELKGLEHML